MEDILTDDNQQPPINNVGDERTKKEQQGDEAISRHQNSLKIDTSSSREHVSVLSINSPPLSPMTSDGSEMVNQDDEEINDEEANNDTQRKEGCTIDGCGCIRYREGPTHSGVCYRKKCKHSKDQHIVFEAKTIAAAALQDPHSLVGLENLTHAQVKDNLLMRAYQETNSVNIELEKKEEEIRVGCRHCDCNKFHPNITRPAICMSKKCRHSIDVHLTQAAYDAIMKEREDKKLAKEKLEEEEFKKMGFGKAGLEKM